MVFFYAQFEIYNVFQSTFFFKSTKKWRGKKTSLCLYYLSINSFFCVSLTQSIYMSRLFSPSISSKIFLYFFSVLLTLIWHRKVHLSSCYTFTPPSLSLPVCPLTPALSIARSAAPPAHVTVALQIPLHLVFLPAEQIERHRSDIYHHLRPPSLSLVIHFLCHSVSLPVVFLLVFSIPFADSQTGNIPRPNVLEKKRLTFWMI